MNLPDFKEIKTKLGPLMNRAILTPVIVTIVGLILLIPTQLMSGRLKAKVKSDSVSMGNRLRSIEAVPEDQWKIEKEYQDAFAADANLAALFSLQSTQRELLSYRLFPDPCSTSQMIFQNYAEAYTAGIKQFVSQVNGVWRPSDAEFQNALEKAAAGNPRGRNRNLSRLFQNRGNTRTNMRNIRLTETEQTIIDLLCTEKAKEGHVYAGSADVAGFNFWETFQYEGAESAVKNCWYYQLAYWITGDVFDTVKTMNEGSTSILNSKVKRISRVGFTLNKKGRSGALSRPSPSQKDDLPSYAKSASEGLTDACTGRYCDENWDVVHFNVVVIVQADASFTFLTELCKGKTHVFKGWSGDQPAQTMNHNQITVLECSTTSVDRDAGDHMLYRYGENAVVELNLICEYLFYKPAYDMIMPQQIKDDLAEESNPRRRR